MFKIRMSYFMLCKYLKIKMHGFDAHLGLTNFFQHSLAQSTIYIHTMHKADRRTTNDEDDKHGLPQVQPGETTLDGVTWIGDGWKRGRGPW